MSSTVALPPPVAAVLEPIMIEPAQKLLLHNVSWESYIAIGNALSERGNLHLTYDEGRLEIMSLSQVHEMLKFLLCRLIDVLLEELDIPSNGYGQMTHQRQDLGKAFEPDACYYIKNWEKVRELEQIDLSRDPPPDLALEVDITSSSIKRMPLYERIGVAELWRFERNTITVYVLNAEGHYEKAERSPTFPMVPVEELLPFVQKGIKEGHIAMIRVFRGWVRERIGSVNGS